MEPELLHEVPESLKRLVRLTVRGFYSIEHAIILDLLVRHPCMKEDDIIDLLKFERKQLRSMLNTLKMDKIVKVRMRVETDAEGHTTRHNYYFINYKVFVNVVKYKLDHVRRKIEAAERQNTSRSSFKCLQCQKTYTDLEAGQLLDPYTGLLMCMICQLEVEEDESAIPKQDARTMLAKFNEQIQPIYDLLKDCEDVRLAPEILEPEPVDMKSITQKSQNSNSKYDKSVWSGDATKNINYGYEENTVTITVSDETNQRDNKPVKEQPVWMKESTIEKSSSVVVKPAEVMHKPSTSKADSMECSDDIMRTLLVHEKKSVAATASMALFAASDHGSSSDSDEETVQPSTSVMGVEEMESGDEEEEEEVPMVSIGELRVPLHEVTDNMVTKMTVEEKENYIRLGQELYQHLYE